MGAADRDVHSLNMVYRDNRMTHVVAFTAAQILGIANRKYPLSLAGPNYPNGIPILDEEELEAICRRKGIERVVFT